MFFSPLLIWKNPRSDIWYFNDMHTTLLEMALQDTATILTTGDCQSTDFPDFAVLSAAAALSLATVASDQQRFRRRCHDCGLKSSARKAGLALRWLNVTGPLYGPVIEGGLVQVRPDANDAIRFQPTCNERRQRMVPSSSPLDFRELCLNGIGSWDGMKY